MDLSRIQIHALYRSLKVKREGFTHVHFIKRVHDIATESIYKRLCERASFSTLQRCILCLYIIICIALSYTDLVYPLHVNITCAQTLPIYESSKF